MSERFRRLLRALWCDLRILDERVAELDREIALISPTRFQGPPEGDLDFMAAFQPYHGGNYHLWAINKLCNTNKHEIIAPMGLSVGDMFAEHFFSDNAIETSFPPKWDSRKNEMELCRVVPGSKVPYKMEFKFLVALAQIRGFESKLASAVLSHQIDIVERIVRAIEAEAKRLGII